MYEYEPWLAIAQQDLKVAGLMFKHKSYRNVADYCQQVTEKALKAYLVYHQQEIIKTHNLIALRNLCKKLDPDFQLLTDALKPLMPYATEFKEPLNFPEPGEDQAAHFIKHAEDVLAFVLKKISETIARSND